MCSVGRFSLLVVFCIVRGGVNDDGGVSEVMFCYEVECSLKRECLVESDVVLCLWFVVCFVYVVHGVLDVCCLCVFVVAVMDEREFRKNAVVAVVIVGWRKMDGRGQRRDGRMATDRRRVGERSERRMRKRRRSQFPFLFLFLSSTALPRFVIFR